MKADTLKLEEKIYLWAEKDGIRSKIIESDVIREKYEVSNYTQLYEAIQKDKSDMVVFDRSIKDLQFYRDNKTNIVCSTNFGPRDS
ncbi:hypothetical protein [Enterococcus casseliflavus]|uniref:hypothetical protein n=1 Tax=Enterococcus casseliflavus TaxID=37734 RepID=UPI00188408B5|nr:hypothetical protein [Enterococcus casseliflavus]